VLTALVLSVSVVLLGTTILNVALPEMTAALHLSNTAQQWVLNSYTLTFAGFLLIAGSLGDRFGPRRTLLFGLVGFAVTAALASLPTTVWFIIAMRALMGVFAATIMPTTLAIILRTFPAERRGRAISIWAAASGIAVSAGPVIGGALLSAGLWWGSVLVLVAAMSVLALLVSWRGIHHLSGHHTARLRVIPVLASVTGIALLVWGVLDGGQHGDWLAAGALVPLAAGVAVLAALAVIEARAEQPIADVRLFRRAQFAVPVVALSIGSFVYFGYLYVTTFYLQVDRAYTPFQTGLIFVPLSLGLVIGSLLAARLVTAVGPRMTMTCGLTLTAIGLGGLAFLDGHSSLVYFIADMFAIALGFALVLTPGTTLAMSGVPAQRAGGGSALLNTLRQIASALGVAILGSLLWSSYRGNVLPHLTALPAADRMAAAQSLAATLHAADGNPAITAAASTAFDSALHVTTITAAALTLVAALIVLITPASTRALPGGKGV
jgi:EmrB/QacA subfamily drug resistance transporter